MAFKNLSLFVFSLFIIAACGGGGGGESTTPPAATVVVRPVLLTYVLQFVKPAAAHTVVM